MILRHLQSIHKRYLRKSELRRHFNVFATAQLIMTLARVCLLCILIVSKGVHCAAHQLSLYGIMLTSNCATLSANLLLNNNSHSRAVLLSCTIVFTMRRYASTVYAVTVCLSVIRLSVTRKSSFKTAKDHANNTTR